MKNNFLSSIMLLTAVLLSSLPIGPVGCRTKKNSNKSSATMPKNSVSSATKNEADALETLVEK